MASRNDSGKIPGIGFWGTLPRNGFCAFERLVAAEFTMADDALISSGGVDGRSGVATEVWPARRTGTERYMRATAVKTLRLVHCRSVTRCSSITFLPFTSS